MRQFILFLAALAVFAAATPRDFGHTAGIAHAQQQKKPKAELQERRPNLLQLLFGGGLRKQNLLNRDGVPKARRVIVSPQGGGVAGSMQSAPKTIVEKAETASKILVIGDFIADGLHWGLEQAYAGNANAVLVNKSSGLSGLVRDDVVNWPLAVATLIDEFKPVAVVVVAGMNDRQQMRLATGRVAKLSDPWKGEYDARVDALVKAIRSRNVQLVWLGLPPVKSGVMNSDYLVFNEIYRAKVEAGGGKFVDVWDGFTNAEGQFVNAGPDINGQIVRLRNSDGINMTRAGMSKLAFYAEKELKKLVGLGAEVAVASLSGPDGSAMMLEPQYDPAGTGRTVIIALDSPQADGGDVLEGSEGFLTEKTAARSMSFDLVARGMVLQPHDGRVDAGWGVPAPVAAIPAAAAEAPAQPAVGTEPPKKPVSTN